MAAGRSQIDNYLVSGVTSQMLEAMTRLGIIWKLNGTSLTVDGKGLGGFSISLWPIKLWQFCLNIAFFWPERWHPVEPCVLERDPTVCAAARWTAFHPIAADGRKY
jgi:hypothetical protein